jgi:Heterokaryon incompatibility protein (HET)
LEAGQIRLITVFPLTPSRTGCQFLHVPLNDLPVSYTALSYVWGDPAVISKVYCGEHHVLGLTASAHYLLNLIAETGVGLYFWIDLLCINQADDEEKARQVRMMGDIFASAERVSAWLGEPSLDSGYALHFVLTLMNAIRGYPNIHKDGHPTTMDELCRSYPSSAWRALSNLLRRPWFQRIWVVQEAVRARHLTIFFDSPRVAINWDHLSTVINILRITDNDLMLRVYPTDYSIPSFPPDGILNTGIMNGFKYVRQIGRPLTLQAALVECRRFKSTKPHDMIYAMLGIAADAGDSALDPDYAAPAQKIFTQTTQTLLTRNVSVQILHIAGIWVAARSTRDPLVGP